MDHTTYQFTSKEGDIVRMPNGLVGIISGWDILCGGNVKEVCVYPFTNWLHRLILTLRSKTTFYDEQINTLTPLTKAAP